MAKRKARTAKGGAEESRASSTKVLESVRVDKWLWAARCFKTRSQSTQACDAGHVRINKATAKASRPVKIGDLVDVITNGGARVLKVEGLALRRGSAEVAAKLFDDQTPPPPEVPEESPRWERGGARPTKRDRRRMDKFRTF